MEPATAETDVIRIEGVKEVIGLRMTNTKGQRMSAYVLLRNPVDLDHQVANLVIMDDELGRSERAFVFPGNANVVDAGSFKRFLKEFRVGAVKVGEGGVRTQLGPGEVDFVELQRSG